MFASQRTRGQLLDLSIQARRDADEAPLFQPVFGKENANPSGPVELNDVPVSHRGQAGVIVPRAAVVLIRLDFADRIIECGVIDLAGCIGECVFTVCASGQRGDDQYEAATVSPHGFLPLPSSRVATSVRPSTASWVLLPVASQLTSAI